MIADREQTLFWKIVRQGPNLLTLSRLLLSPLIAVLLLNGNDRATFSLFAIACATDALDGFMARLMKSKTTLGRYLDPLADKMLLIIVFVTLSHLGHVHILMTGLVIVRDAIIILGALLLHRHRLETNIRPLLIGKLTTVAQMILLALTLFCLAFPEQAQTLLPHPMLMIWTVFTAFITVVSGIMYALSTFTYFRRKSPTPLQEGA